jgi:ComF family protein
LLKELLNIFYPKQCIACETYLVGNEEYICSSCRHDLPETNFIESKDNLLEEALKGRVPIEAASALLYYRKKGKVQSLIHSLKYKNKQKIGVFFAKWIGAQLNDNKRIKDIDGIVIVPLHPKRFKERGYNQLTVFADQLSKELKVPVFDEVLIKISQASSQTKKGRSGRFEKINERFKIKDNKILENKHILLVDDIFTTGATIEACANELFKTTNIKISIVTMAVSEPY